MFRRWESIPADELIWHFDSCQPIVSVTATPTEITSDLAWALPTRVNDKTVIRGGAGVYYGLNFATNWQYGGTAWNGSVPFHASEDSGFTQHASMTNPYPDGLSLPQEGKYGALTLYGLENFNHASLNVRNAEIYQWNLGVQHQFGGSMLIEVNYSANRSTHLPWDKSLRSQDFVSATDRVKCDPNDPTVCGTAYLNEQVPNPFQYLFVQLPGQPAPIFNEPTSSYNNDTIPRVNILRPYPQFQALYGFTPFEPHRSTIPCKCASKSAIRTA